MPTKQRLTKQDITQAHIIDSTKEHNPLLDYLAKHHPQTISEERLNLDALSQALGFSPSSMQGYGLSFIGKPLANALYSTPTTKELKELDPKHSQNIIIKGDNLHALKLLKSAYDGKIKMIYIDPPYNTKNEKFIYDDNFVKEYQKLLIELDLLKLDSNGEVLEKSEVLHFLTNPSGDKAHSGWLAFMLPRLKLARDLLKDDGVIFISIDDNEQANLKILCDEIFGEENFVNSIFILDNLKGKANDNLISNVGHKVLGYAKNIATLNDSGGFKEIENIFGDKIDNKFKNEDSLGFYTLNTFCKTGQGRFREERPFMYYPILLKNEKLELVTENEFIKIYDKKTKKFDDNLIRTLKEKYEKMGFVFLLPLSKKNEKLRWTSSYNTAKNLIEIGDLIWDNGVKQKKRPSATEMLQVYASGVPKSFFYKPQYANGTDELIKIFDKDIFSFPKSTFLIKDILKISTNTGGGEI
ncbi:site-specific DNA-methyltransferase [Campylobacter sp.]|uniref:site-specific DNA-methyltransferase n=1 Tax=Campylobacter sp. TaxID=205 RepID=UPI0026DD7A65|nr:site-specific DNA-methyltransferase [Campylobacter sp.]MDO4674468.1 site-specific DNA-methyltransferase [Campylobacter sp.]